MKSLIILGCLLFVGVNSQVENNDNVIINVFCDRVISNVRDFMILHNMDPLHIQDMEIPFNFSFLGQHEGHLSLKNGLLTDLSTIERKGDCTLSYDLKLLLVSVSVQVQDLEAAFDFVLDALGLSPDGTMFATITEQQISMDFLVDFYQTTVTLQDFQMPNNGKIDLDIKGLGILGDAAANVLIEVITALFKDTIIKNIGAQIGAAMDQIISSFPPLLPPIPAGNTTMVKSLIENIHVKVVNM